MIVFQVFLFHIRKHSPHLLGSERGVCTTCGHFLFFPLLTRQRELRFYDIAADFLKEPFTTLFHTFLRFNPLFLIKFPLYLRGSENFIFTTLFKNIISAR